MKVETRIRRLQLLVQFANKLVENKGITELKRLGKLDWSVDSDYFNDLLRVTKLWPEFEGVKGVRFNIRQSLYKRMRYGIEYITLLDSLEDDEHYPDFKWYESKLNIDACSAIQEMKKLVRVMIKSPDDHCRVTSY